MKKFLIINLFLCHICFSGNVLRSDQIPDIYGANGFKVEYSPINNIPKYKVSFSPSTKLPTIAAIFDIEIKTWKSPSSSSTYVCLSSDSIINNRRMNPSLIDEIKLNSTNSSPVYTHIKIGSLKEWEQSKFIILLQTWQYTDIVGRFGILSGFKDSEWDSKVDDVRVQWKSDGFSICAEKGGVNNYTVTTLVSVMILFAGEE